MNLIEVVKTRYATKKFDASKKINDADFDKIKGNPNFSIIGHITEENQGLQLVTRANPEIELKAQGWNGMKDN